RTTLIAPLGFAGSVLAFGALSLIAGCAPARGSGPQLDRAVSPAAGEPARAEPSLAWRTSTSDGSHSTVEVAGLGQGTLASLRKPEMTRDRWTRFLRVRVVLGAEAGSNESPALLGFYRLEGHIIRFVPRFPLEPGIRYRAEFDPIALDRVCRE